jgi:integrase
MFFVVSSFAKHKEATQRPHKDIRSLREMSKERMPDFKGSFTDVYLKSLRSWCRKNPPDKEKDIREGRGFGIRIRKTGAIIFFYMYHFEGKRWFMNFGPYAPQPEVTPSCISLSDARQKHAGAYALLKSGVNPLAPPPPPSPEPEVMTVERLIPLYLKSLEGSLVPRSIRQQQRVLENNMLSYWRSRQVDGIRRPDAITLIETVKQRAPGTARNLKKASSTMFEFAVGKGFTEFNPFSRVQKHVRGIAPKSGDRLLSDDEIKVIWQKTEGAEIGRALRLMLVTGQRPNEVTGMMWNEIDGNWWQINWRRIKTECSPRLERDPQDHRVYLTPLALSLLPKKKNDGDEYVFPAKGRGRGKGAEGGMRPGTVSHELTEGKWERYFGLPIWTPKDLRRTVRTGMARLGVPEVHGEAVLNHIQGGVKGTYNLYKYDKEKRQALTKWSKHVESLIKPPAPADE